MALGCRVTLLDWLSVRAAVLLNLSHTLDQIPHYEILQKLLLRVGGGTLDVTQMRYALQLTGYPVPRQINCCELF